ncbi:AsiA anti-sigma 70 protein [Acinetobacter phage Ac42]|uniref:anti-sigma factor n=1 Tax=Acinetobacter phage Ac42 TaxID=762660 RepID=UPI0001EBCE22|nr:anti-sigma factor [Acinetobacter phage Ac42]ADI96486.1 AsiA anti-sigma 70 protein [Acinetobacter phage Ac42]
MYNILADIIATASILIKFGHDDILENQRTFVAFLNELGFKTVEGRPITLTNLFNMTQDITTREKDKLIEEFNIGHEPIYRKLELHLNCSKY